MAQINVTVAEETYRKAKVKAGMLRLSMKAFVERVLLENTKNIFLDKEVIKEIKKENKNDK